MKIKHKFWNIKNKEVQRKKYSKSQKEWSISQKNPETVLRKRKWSTASQTWKGLQNRDINEV